MENELKISGLKGVVNTQAFPLPGIDAEVIQLPDRACKWAMLANWTVVGDDARTAKPGANAATPNSGNPDVEMYWGFNGKLFAQLFTGNTTDFLPVNNLNQICIKGNGTVYVAWGI